MTFGHYVCGIIGTISFIMVNAVSNDVVSIFQLKFVSKFVKIIFLKSAEWWCCLWWWMFRRKWGQDLVIPRFCFGFLCCHCQCLGDDCRPKRSSHHRRNPISATKYFHSCCIFTLQIWKTWQQCIQWKNLNIIFLKLLLEQRSSKKN